MEKPNVFLSVGKTHTDQQEKFVQSVEKFLIANGLNPQTVGRTYFANQQPLKSVEELMHKSAGIVVLALERTYIPKAISKPNSPQKTELDEVKLPTVWNQIEATMAYTIGLPLFVMAENGIKSEGLIETGYDLYVKWFTPDEFSFDDKEFAGIFESWKNSVHAYKTSKDDEANQPVPTIGTPKHLTQLRQILSEKFSEDELRTFVFDLGEDYESLPGSNKSTKAMELVAKMNRHGRLQELIDEGKQARQDVSWV